MITPLGINGGDHDKCKAEELMTLMFKFTGGLPGTKRNNYFKSHDKLFTCFICNYCYISRRSFTNTGKCS